MSWPIAALELGSRAYRALVNSYITDIPTLRKALAHNEPDIRHLPEIGKVTFREIMEALAAYDARQASKSNEMTKITEKNIHDLAHWFRRRKIEPLTAVSMMGGIISELIANCAPDPIDAVDRFSNKLRDLISAKLETTSSPFRRSKSPKPRASKGPDSPTPAK